MSKIVKSLLLSAAVLLLGCGTKPASVSRTPADSLSRGAFNADSAYAFVARQVAFGPRVPGTEAHSDCIHWLVSTLSRFGASVTMQQGYMPCYDGSQQLVRNIVAHIPADSAATNLPAVLLVAHYDSRPWTDAEDLYDDRFHGVPAANDGASGVAVLLELARVLAGAAPRPVTILLTDCEDMGTPQWYTGPERENTWCLGAQYWAQTNTQPYKYGILLDMVGDPNAVFYREYISEQHAKHIVDRIWHTAGQLGYGARFVDQVAYPITDDHFYITSIAHIPVVDIIHTVPGSDTGFAWWWHTTHDTMDNISSETLRQVGEVILLTIYS